MLRPLSHTGLPGSPWSRQGPGPRLPTRLRHSPTSPTPAHLGPSPRLPLSPTPPSPGSGPEPPTPPGPVALSRRLQVLPTRASRAHRASGFFSAGRRAPSAPAPSPGSLSRPGLSPPQPPCSRLPPPPFILPGPAPGQASRALSPRSLAGHPLSPLCQPPSPIPQPVSVPAACQLFLAAELLIHAAPAECARSLPRGRRGRGPSCPGCWGSGARTMGDPASADLSFHLPPRARRAGTAGHQPGSAEGEWLRSQCQVESAVGRSAD